MLKDSYSIFILEEGLFIKFTSLTEEEEIMVQIAKSIYSINCG